MQDRTIRRKNLWVSGGLFLLTINQKAVQCSLKRNIVYLRQNFPFFALQINQNMFGPLFYGYRALCAEIHEKTSAVEFLQSHGLFLEDC